MEVSRLALGLSRVSCDLCPAAWPLSLSLYSQALLWGTVSRLDVARLPSPTSLRQQSFAAMRCGPPGGPTCVLSAHEATVPDGV